MLVVAAPKAGRHLINISVGLVGLLGFIDVALAHHGAVVEIRLHKLVVRLREVLDARLVPTI